MTPTSTSTSREKFSTLTSGRRSVVALEFSAVYLVWRTCLFLTSD